MTQCEANLSEAATSDASQGACKHPSNTPEQAQKNDLEQVQPTEAEAVRHHHHQQQQQQGKDHAWEVPALAGEVEKSKRGHEDCGNGGGLTEISVPSTRGLQGDDERSSFQRPPLPVGVKGGERTQAMYDKIVLGASAEWKSQRPSRESNGNRPSGSSMSSSSNSSSFQKPLPPAGIRGGGSAPFGEWKAQWPSRESDANRPSSSSISFSSNSNSSRSLPSSHQPSGQTRRPAGRSDADMLAGQCPPAVQKALKGAMKARQARQTQPGQYASRLEEADDGSRAQHFVQAACRFAIKVQGTQLPESIPHSSLAQLQQRLTRYQRLMPAAQTAVRTGCVVINYSATSSSNSGLNDMRADALAVAKDWALENGLLQAGQENMLTIQACHQSAWGITQQQQQQQEQLSTSGYSMVLQTPFLIISPSSKQAELDAPALPQEQEACSCQFEVTLAAPPHLELRGWQGAVDAPEELPDEIKSRSLCLLASVDGQFLPTSVEQHSMSSDGERVARAHVILLGANTSCPKVVVLEVWADGFMVCSYSAVLLPSSYSGALAELQGMRQGDEEGSRVFVRDLVLWAHFLASSRSAQQQQLKQQQGAVAVKDTADDVAAGEPNNEQLVLMALIGSNLLEHCSAEGAVAGFLMDGFVQAPFYIPSAALLADATAPPTTFTASRHGSSRLGMCGSSSSSVSNAHGAVQTSTAPMTARQGSSAVVGKATTGEVEAQYQAWMNAQVASHAKGWCTAVALLIGGGVLRAALTGDTRLHMELASWHIMLAMHVVAALCIQPKPFSFSSASAPSSRTKCRTNEVLLAGVSAVRACFCGCVGLGLSPLTSSIKLFLRWRLEAIVEVTIMSIMEQVRLSGMLPLRLIFLSVGFGLWYERMGFAYPYAQAALIHACALGVTAIMDRRCRRLFAKARLKAKQVALESAHEPQYPKAGSSKHFKKIE